MKNITLLSVLLLSVISINAQESSDFNKWTIEATVGQAKGITPYYKGYFSGKPDGSFINFIPNSITVGARYMVSPTFGFKAAINYDQIENVKSSESLPFQMNQIGLSVQGYVNGSKLLGMQDYIKRFGLLFHGGIKVDQMTSKTKNIVENDHNYGKTEYNGGVVIGVTPQYRIGKKVSVMLDVSFQTSYRQHFNWDGTYSDESNNLNGKLSSLNLGLSYSLGKNEIHGDWVVVDKASEDLRKEIDSLEKRIGDVETLMNDTDKDGIADYLDQENNSVAGVAVDSRGKMVDQNRNGVPDELERYVNTTSKETSEKSNADAVKRLVNEGYVSTYFDTGKSQPTNVSTEGIDFIRTYLRNNPKATVDVYGHADEIGSTERNNALAKARAEAVKTILVKSGIEANRINVVPVGEDSSVDKDSDGARKLVRRVTFKVKE